MDDEIGVCVKKHPPPPLTASSIYSTAPMSGGGTRGYPKISVSGRSGALGSPASIQGESGRRPKSPASACTK